MKKTKKAVKKKTTKKKVVKKVAKKVVKKREPKNTDIVMTSPIDPSSQIVMSSELADDSMIEAELMGEVLPHYIYEFDQKGKKITGLTVKGVNEVVRRLNRKRSKGEMDSGYKITLPPEHLKIERDVSYDGVLGIEVRVFAVNLIDGTSAWGIKFEPYKKSGRNGSYENTFAIEKALSKAERNAKRKLIPETVATKMIEKMIATDPNSVKRLEPVQSKQISVTPIPPKPSTPAELKTVIINAIKFSKDSGYIIEFDKKVQVDKRFEKDEDFKAQVHQLAELRVNELEK